MLLQSQLIQKLTFQVHLLLKLVVKPTQSSDFSLYQLVTALELLHESVSFLLLLL